MVGMVAGSHCSIKDVNAGSLCLALLEARARFGIGMNMKSRRKEIDALLLEFSSVYFACFKRCG